MMVMVMMMIMGHEHIWGTVWGGYQSEGRGRKERIGVKKMDVLYIYRERERANSSNTR
jgi:hypothetical protein